MEMLSTLRRLFEYDAWASLETLASLRAATPLPDRAVAILAHVAGAKEMWLSRLQRDGSAPATWPEMDLDGLEGRLAELADRWRAYLQGLRADDLDRESTYTNTRGDTFTNRVGDVLLQLILHGAYHRGQVAVLLRGSGAQPAPTDYIRAVRLGLID